ncbi:MAG: toxin-antitoxin system YwqK family antitoxin [Myxococcota bacterium]
MSADETATTPFPSLEAPPRNGTHRTFHDDGEQLELEGEVVDGLADGTWTWFYESGQKHWEIEYEAGLKDGSEVGWHDNGQKMYEGQNVDHKRSGTWTWWHDNGEYKQAYHYDDDGEKHGEYIWDDAEGNPKARGGFWHGKRHGDWVWHTTGTHEKVARGYRRGMHHGEEAAWFEGGQLAYRRQWADGKRHGDNVEFYDDGRPKLEETWEHGYLHGEKKTWDVEGNETVQTYQHGLTQELAADTDLMEKTAKKIAKARDRYGKEDVLREAIGYNEQTPFLIEMVRHGHFDIASDSDLWQKYTEEPHLLEVDEVIELIRTGEGNKDGYTPVLPGWPSAFEEAAMRTYSRDPEAFQNAFDDLPNERKLGVAFVMARFGEDMSDVLEGRIEQLASVHAETRLRDRMLWPDEDGNLEKIELYDSQVPNDNFDRFIELFGSTDEWAQALLQQALGEADEAVSRIYFPYFKHAIQAATTEQMPALLAGCSLDQNTAKNIERALMNWRDDDPAAVAEMAIAVDDTGLRKWPSVACAILELSAAGEGIADALIDAVELDSGSPSLNWIDQKVHQLEDDDHKKDLAHYDTLFSVAEPGYAFPKLELLFRAMKELPEDAIRKLIEEAMDSDYGKTRIAPYLHLVDDPELWRRGIEAIVEDSYTSSHSVALGLAHLPPAALPLLEAGYNDCDKQEDKKTFQRAIIGVLAGAAERDEDVDEKWDEWIKFNAVQKKYDYPYLRPLLFKAVYHLPRERAVAVMERELGRNSTFGRAFRYLAAHTEQALVESAFQTLLEREASLTGDDPREIQAGIEYLQDSRAAVKWLLQNGAGSHMKSQFQQAVGHDTFEEIEKELEEEGSQTAKELDDIDKLAMLAEEVGGTGETIYVLRRLDEKPEDAGYNQIGGLPPGIGEERWPTMDGEPMAHLYTLDVETMPELRSLVGEDTRTVSVFCFQPDYNEAWEAYNEWTAVVYSSDEQLEDAELELPDDVPDRSEAWFEPVAIEVSPGIWAEEGSELRGKIYQASARVLGEPIWLQYPEGGGTFLMQFDESFAWMNLGDSGVMYVFGDTAFWQCH